MHACVYTGPSYLRLTVFISCFLLSLWAVRSNSEKSSYKRICYYHYKHTHSFTGLEPVGENLDGLHNEEPSNYSIGRSNGRDDVASHGFKHTSDQNYLQIQKHV